jgi:isocitrate dehydrogenase (NAD+)
MPKRRIAVIPGDGIGPEIMDATLSVLEATGLDAEWVYVDAGLAALERCASAVPEETIETIRDVGFAIKGPTTTPSSGGHQSANVQMRKALDLYANVRPAHSLPGIKTPFDDKKIDIITIRENTEDLYAGIEYMPHPDMAQAIKVITRPGCQRLCEYGFQLARRTGRKRLTAVHKANIMKLTDGMFLEEFHKVAARYPDLAADEIIVDNCCMQLVTRPEQFDMLVTENLYGDIISDLCAGLVGGLGLAAGANIGEKCAVFEAVHGSAPDIAGKGIANPTALILSGVMMLHHLEEHEKANRLMDAVVHACADGSVLTGDLGGKATTKQYAAHLSTLVQQPVGV